MMSEYNPIRPAGAQEWDGYILSEQGFSSEEERQKAKEKLDENKKYIADHMRKLKKR
ncbi:MAG: hypothetical protein KBS74_08325 [Clostridiales bacterium]|nr:hypothetical protein [Candidatus Cacconaster stercorequi]